MGRAKVTVEAENPSEFLNWHLEMKFHSEPTFGHSVGKTEECSACDQIRDAVTKWLATYNIEVE